MKSDHQRPFQSDRALPPIVRRPVGSVTKSTGPVSDAGSVPRPSASGPARLLIGAHLLLLIQSGLIVFSRIELGAARTGIAAITAVSAIALGWAVVDRFRQPSPKSRRLRHEA